MTYYLTISGPAGSGKSTLTHALSEWMEDNELDAIKVNFDPAAEVMPYIPDVDVKRYVNYHDFMVKHGLGPNGALTASVDYLINYVREIRDEIDELKGNYALIDLPGQLEVIAFRQLGPTILKELTRGARSAMLFVLDARLASEPKSAFSFALLALSTLYRVSMPMIIVLNKADLLAEEGGQARDLNSILSDKVYLIRMLSDEYDCIDASTLALFVDADVSEELCKAIKVALGREVVPVSAKLGWGLDDLYAVIQRALIGGDDFLTEEYSSRV